MINKDLLQPKRIWKGNIYEVNESQRFDEKLKDNHLYCFIAFGISSVFYYYIPFIFKRNGEICNIEASFNDDSTMCRWRINVKSNEFLLNVGSINMAENTAILECWQIT